MLRTFFRSLTERQVIIGLVILTVAVFAVPVLRNQFVTIDDNYLIYENPAVKELTLANLKHVFSSYDPQLYIPLTFVSYQLNALFGMNPVGFHMVNLALHCANAALVLIIVRKLSKSMFAATIAAALFAIHPLQTEAVLWASSRKDLLSGFFFLSSALEYLRYRESEVRRHLLISILLYALALLSKVSIILLPFWLLGIDWMQRRPLSKEVLTEKIPYGVLAVIFGIIAVIGKSTVLASSGTLVNALLPAKSAMFYVEKFFVPTGFSVIYPYVPEAGSILKDFGPSVLAIAILLLILGYLVVRGRHRLAALLLGTYFLLLAPSFSTFWKNGYLFFASDRYAYLAVIGLFALVGLFFDRLRAVSERRGMTPFLSGGAALALILAFVPFTLAQSAAWKDSIALFENVLRHYPDSVMAQTNLGLELQQAGKLAEARAHYERALEIDPHSTHAYFNLASLAHEEGKEDEATALNIATIDAFGAQQVTSAYDTKPFLWLIDKLQSVGKPGDAFRLAEKLARIAYPFPGPHEAYGELLRERGNDELALKEFEAAAKAGSTKPETYYYLTEYYSGSGKMTEAIAALRKGVKLDPKNLAASQKLRELEAAAR